MLGKKNFTFPIPGSFIDVGMSLVTLPIPSHSSLASAYSISAGIKCSCGGSNPAPLPEADKSNTWTSHSLVPPGHISRASNTHSDLAGMGNDITGLPAHSDPQRRARKPPSCRLLTRRCVDAPPSVCNTGDVFEL